MKRRTHELADIIVGEQEADGSFLSRSWPAGREARESDRVYRTTFLTAVLLGAVAKVEAPGLDGVRQRAADFLLRQAGPQWSFNYWARDAPERQTKPYPDDWDDTATALAALTLARPEQIGGEVLGHVVGLLTATEVQEGGPYRTWILPEDAA